MSARHRHTTQKRVSALEFGNGGANEGQNVTVSEKQGQKATLLQTKTPAISTAGRKNPGNFDRNPGKSYVPAVPLQMAPSPVLKSDPVVVELCTSCGLRPQAAGGRLSRCLSCIQAAEAVARAQREEIHQRALAKAAAAKAAANVKAVEHLKCESCKKSKPVSEFSPHRLSRTGFRKSCRPCCRADRIKRAEPTDAERTKDMQRRAQEHRRQSNRQAVKAWQARNPAAAAAKSAVNRALNAGRLKRAKQCMADACEATHRLQAHHHSYAEKHWLDVGWFCAKHHKRGHARGFIRLKTGIPPRLGRIPKSH